MPAVKDEAVALRRLDYSETSQVLAFYTRRHGLRRLIAKGIKRGTRNRFAVGVDLLERGSVVFLPRPQEARGLGTLTEWRQTQAWLALRDSLPRWYAAQYLAEVTCAMTEEADAHEGLYLALVAALDRLSTADDPFPATVGYLHALLTSAGLWPELGRCVSCGKLAPPGRAGYFAAGQGGLICRDCEPAVAEKRKLSAATLDALRGGPAAPPAVREAFVALDEAVATAVGRPTDIGRIMRRL